MAPLPGTTYNIYSNYPTCSWYNDHSRVLKTEVCGEPLMVHPGIYMAAVIKDVVSEFCGVTCNVSILLRFFRSMIVLFDVDTLRRMIKYDPARQIASRFCILPYMLLCT